MSRPPTWTAPRIAQLVALWDADELTQDEIAKQLGTSVGAIKRLARQGRVTLRRKSAKRTTRLHAGHSSILAGTTLFPNTIVDPEDAPRLLVDGQQQQKLGRMVTVGAWAGMPFYALTLIERATCPPSCKTWAICYGNNMPQARRHQLTPAIMPLLSRELDALDLKHRKAGGYVVRLHVLGDFDSPSDEALALDYVDFWHTQLIKRPMLHVFGYTAHPADSPIGEAIEGMCLTNRRCWIRFSGTDAGRFGSVVIKTPDEAPPGAIVCPYERGSVPNCGGCGLCWKAKRTIAFLEH